mgnify:CR=1 FL=1
MFYCECSKGSPKAVCLCSLKNRSLQSVNEDFEGKRNAENLCKRVKCKVYFVILQRVQPNLGNQIHLFILLLFNLSAVKETYCARGLLRLLLIVSNHHYGAPILLVQCVQNIHDFCTHL